MRLDFNVLWVDDQPERVAAQVLRIEKQMEGEGFHFNSTPCKTFDEVQKLVKDDVFTDEIDLVLVDWDLGNNLQGQDVIASIRETVRYKDVVFYSAQTPTDELRRLAFEKGLEGVYCAIREELVDEVLGCSSLSSRRCSIWIICAASSWGQQATSTRWSMNA